ncbi:MAG: CopG family transcriptional regulator [Alphaproteobacteria bacterium]|nr:CopG family transcriptional regulator [Alphaproteobacteria bacterium]
MRTTLSLDDDVLAAAKARAEQQHCSLGEVISDLARRGLAPSAIPAQTRNGLTLLPPSPTGRPVTADDVRKLRDDLS